MWTSPVRVALAAAEPYLTSQRAWLDRLAVVVPAPAATRWLLVADLACLIALGLATHRRALGIPLTLAAGFIVLNLLGMALTDFYLGLTVFHLLVGLVAMLTLSRARWLGAVTLGLVLVLGHRAQPDGDDNRLRDEAAGRVAIGRVRAVATHAGHSHGVVLPDRVVRRARPSLGLGLGRQRRGLAARRPRPANNRGVARPAFGVAQWQLHVGGLPVRAGQELQGVERGDRPHRHPHAGAVAAVTGDAADRGIPLVMEPGEIFWRQDEQAHELLVVQMARDAEAVVALLGAEPDEEERTDKQGPRPARCVERDAPSESAGDDGGLPSFPPSGRSPSPAWRT